MGSVDEAQWLLSKIEEGAMVKLTGNPWIMPPEAVVEKGLDAVKTYYTDVREAGTEVIPRRLLKVVLVGSSSAGKTSLMKSIISGTAERTKGEPEDISTEGIEVLHEVLQHASEKTSVEFYDCAGQVDYGGMQQVFLTRRALFLLVWDIKTCHHQSGNNFDQEIHERIMRWLYAIHLRAPGTTVILVANKCDTIPTSDVEKTVQRVEKRVKEDLKAWSNKRDANHQGVTLLERSFPTSCKDGAGIPDLRGQIMQEGATEIYVPPIWDLALNFIGELKSLDSTRIVARGNMGLPSTAAVESTDISGPFITMEKLSEHWSKRAGGCKDSALEGALWISEFAGQVLFVDGGNGIFFDVKALSGILKPILSHKAERIPCPPDLSELINDLIKTQILHWELTRHVLSSFLGHTREQSTERIGHELYGILIKLGVALPLTRGEDTTISPPAMLVIMRLSETCSDDNECSIRTLDKEKVTGDRDVTLKWEFDSAGCPYGLVERLIASCHVIGVVEEKSSWRYGARFNSHEYRSRCSGQTRLYWMVIRYNKHGDTRNSGVRHALTVRIIGPVENPRVWKALQFVASALITIAKEWPGVSIQGSPVCPTHATASTAFRLARQDEAHHGHSLVIRRASSLHRGYGCDCNTNPNRVISLVADKLGCMVDITKDPFEGMPESDHPTCTTIRELYDLWRSYAWQTATSFWGFAVLLFGVVTTVDGEKMQNLWQICLVVMIISVVIAGIASVVVCLNMYHRAAGRDGETAPLLPNSV